MFSVVAAQLGAYLTTLQLHTKATELDQLKQEMAAVLVHDLKNPIAAVIANLEFLGMVLTDVSVDVQESVADAQAASERVLRLASNLLDLSRLESTEVSLRKISMPLTKLVDDLARQRRTLAAKRGVTFDITAIPPTLLVDIDRDLVTRLCENILDNGLRYTPDGGRIEVSAAERGDRVDVRIGNTGPAVPAEARAKIFEKFGQASLGGRLNLGLGLYFGRLVVEAHGGHIVVEETPALPAVFCFDLPRAP
jgi:signal transduction histidine kinase